ncbi:MAG TPA: fertility inhibition FinO-like protein [Stenomitos sp.]
MTTSGKLELTIKINKFPEDVRTVENGWREFDLDCDGRSVTVKVKPKVFKKLEQAQESYPMWVAAIAGRMGEATSSGFLLDQPNIQTFERKPKEPKPDGNGQLTEVAQ